MPGGPSEFGGADTSGTLGIQPFPHVPTASEQLSLTYRTGDPSGLTGVRPSIFEGMLTVEEQYAIREAAGEWDKGQIWKEMVGE